MSQLDYLIRAEWRPDHEDIVAIGRNMLATLDGLGKVDPVFSRWSFADLSHTDEDDSDEPPRIPIDEARPQMEHLVEAGVQHDDHGQSRPDWGYSVRAANATHDEDREAAQAVNFGVLAGARAVMTNTLRFTTGAYLQAPDRTLTTYPIFRAAVEVLASNWPCPWVCGYAFNSDYFERSAARDVQPIPYSLFHLAWIAYMSAPLAANIKPPAELVSERTPGGGIILSAVRERLDPTNPDHMRRCRILVDLLSKQIDGARCPARVGPF